MYYDSHFSTRLRQNRRDAAQSVPFSYVFIFGLLLCLTWQTVFAVPMLTNYQGNLKDARGKPLNTTVSLTFSLYDVPAWGTPLWTETHPSVSVKEGMFSVILGSKVKIPETVTQGERYLGVKVNTNAEMMPRQALVSGFFAMRAGVAESVASGSVTADKLGAASITTKKVATGAVTGDKLAANVVTTDKIANGAVTNEKLSAEVQQKLAQTGQSGGIPAAVATLNVTEKLKVGKNSVIVTGDSVYNETGNFWLQSMGTGDLWLQSSDVTNPYNTFINVYGYGKVGIGTDDPKAKLDVNGAVKISSTAGFDATQFGKGLLVIYNDDTRESEISSLDLTNKYVEDHWRFTPLVLNGSKVSIAEQQLGLSPKPGNVGIGLMAGTDPKAKLDVAGGIRTKKGDSMEADDANVGYAFESDGDTGMFSYGGTTTGGSTLALKVDNSRMLGIGRWGVSIGETWGNNLPEGTGGGGGGLARFFLTPGDAGYANFWLNQGGANFRWDDTAKKFKRDEAQYNGFRGFMFYGDHTTHFIHADYWNPTNEWSFQDIHKLARFTITGNAFGINNPTPSYDYALDVGGRVRATAFVQGSDKRWKTNIKLLQGALDSVVKLQGVSYNWNTKDYPDKGFDDKPQIGFIAQEVEPVLPEIVSTDDKGFKGVEYDKMTAVLVEAVKELKAQNDALKTIVCKDHPGELICR